MCIKYRTSWVCIRQRRLSFSEAPAGGEKIESECGKNIIAATKRCNRVPLEISFSNRALCSLQGFFNNRFFNSQTRGHLGWLMNSIYTGITRQWPRCETSILVNIRIYIGGFLKLWILPSYIDISYYVRLHIMTIFFANLYLDSVPGVHQRASDLPPWWVCLFRILRIIFGCSTQIKLLQYFNVYKYKNIFTFPCAQKLTLRRLGSCRTPDHTPDPNLSRPEFFPWRCESAGCAHLRLTSAPDEWKKN